MAKQVWLIDGFNLAYAIPDCFYLLQDRQKLHAQTKLNEILEDWAANQKQSTELHIFWDGAAPDTENPSFELGEPAFAVNQAPQDIRIHDNFFLHYGGDYSADAYIEVYLSGMYFPEKSMVVSSDNGVKLRSKKYRAKGITSDEFRDEYL